MTKLLFILLFLSGGVYSQTKTVNASGDTIILHEDGTWEKVKPKVQTTTATRDVGPTTPMDTRKKAECSILKEGLDEFTGIYTMVTNSKVIATSYNKDLKAVIASFTEKGKQTFYLYLYYDLDLGCVSPSSTTATILLYDKSTIKIEYGGEISCDDSFIFYGDITDYITTLNKTAIYKIRISADHVADVSVSDNYYFIDNLKCVTK